MKNKNKSEAVLLVLIFCLQFAAATAASMLAASSFWVVYGTGPVATFFGAILGIVVSAAVWLITGGVKIRFRSQGGVDDEE